MTVIHVFLVTTRSARTEDDDTGEGDEKDEKEDTHDGDYALKEGVLQAFLCGCRRTATNGLICDIQLQFCFIKKIDC